MKRNRAVLAPIVAVVVNTVRWLPWSSSSWAVAICPSEAAVIRVVRPCWSTVFTSTPWFRKSSTTWQRDKDVQHFKLKGVYSVCVCSVCSTVPASGHVWQHWRGEPRLACCLVRQQLPDPTAACRQTTCHFLLPLSELIQADTERENMYVSNKTCLLCFTFHHNSYC